MTYFSSQAYHSTLFSTCVTAVYTRSKKLLQVITSMSRQRWNVIIDCRNASIRILIRNNRISYPQFTTSVYLVSLDIDCSIHNTKLDNCTRWSKNRLQWLLIGIEKGGYVAIFNVAGLKEDEVFQISITLFCSLNSNCIKVWNFTNSLYLCFLNSGLKFQTLSLSFSLLSKQHFKIKFFINFTI